MAVTTIYQSIDLDNATYQVVNLGANNSFYLIAVPGEVENVKSITFSTAVASGVSDEPLFLKNISIPVMGDEAVQGKLFTSFPNTFYMKPVQVVTADREYSLTEGNFDIEINISPITINIG